jgi:hypothetical protein
MVGCPTRHAADSASAITLRLMPGRWAHNPISAAD